nr:anti-sigma F factor [Maliibacterium massiliense]
MQSENYMELNVPSLSQNEAFARVVVAAFAAQLDPTMQELEDIKTAVSEAVTNAIIHGYENAQGVVHIRAWIAQDTLYVEVADDGVGIADIDKAREPLFTTRPEMERSGLGFTMMESFTDGVEVDSAPGKGTCVRMHKQFGQEQAHTDV